MTSKKYGYQRNKNNVCIFDEFTYKNKPYIVIENKGEKRYSFRGCRFYEQTYLCLLKTNKEIEHEEIILTSHQIRGKKINMPVFNHDTRKLEYEPCKENEYTPKNILIKFNNI